MEFILEKNDSQAGIGFLIALLSGNINLLTSLISSLNSYCIDIFR
jgi:hypothetical protein